MVIFPISCVPVLCQHKGCLQVISSLSMPSLAIVKAQPWPALALLSRSILSCLSHWEDAGGYHDRSQGKEGQRRLTLPGIIFYQTSLQEEPDAGLTEETALASVQSESALLSSNQDSGALVVEENDRDREEIVKAASGYMMASGGCDRRSEWTNHQVAYSKELIEIRQKKR